MALEVVPRWHSQPERSRGVSSPGIGQIAMQGFMNGAVIAPRSGRGSRTPADNTRFAFSGAVAAMCGTIAAIASMPDDPQPSGALFWPALLLGIGLLSVPLARVCRNTTVLLRAEHFLMVGLVYWLLLDPLQGAYPMVGVSHDDAVMAFVAIGIMAVGIWIGVGGTGWSLPKLVLRTVKRRLGTKSLFGAVLVAFFLGMFYFAFSSSFDPVTMIDGLSACRFCAPWSRSSIGGSEAFLEHLKYFGYILPS